MPRTSLSSFLSPIWNNLLWSTRVLELEMGEYFGFGFETESKAGFGLGFVAESKAGFGFGFDPKPTWKSPKPETSQIL